MLTRGGVERRRRLTRERKARWRAAIKSGAGVVSVTLQDLNATTGLLLDLGWLDVAQSEDRKAIGAALGRMISDMVERERWLAAVGVVT
jgi:hypothetical protein